MPVVKRRKCFFLPFLFFLIFLDFYFLLFFPHFDRRFSTFLSLIKKAKAEKKIKWAQFLLNVILFHFIFRKYESRSKVTKTRYKVFDECKITFDGQVFQLNRKKPRISFGLNLLLNAVGINCSFHLQFTSQNLIIAKKTVKRPYSLLLSLSLILCNRWILKVIPPKNSETFVATAQGKKAWKKKGFQWINSFQINLNQNHEGNRPRSSRTVRKSNRVKGESVGSGYRREWLGMSWYRVDNIGLGYVNSSKRWIEHQPYYISGTNDLSSKYRIIYAT